MKKYYSKIQLLFFLCCFASSFPSIAQNKDILIFGNKSSEKKHIVKSNLSESYIGGMGETARRMLPPETEDWKGGTICFQMKVNPDKQNYFSIRCWGDESDRTMVLLFIDGKQIGYRHVGDIDHIHHGNGLKPLPGRFYYYTIPLPLKYTKGKKEVSLELRSYGQVWPYGMNFASYQKMMDQPTIGFYKAYTHTTPCIQPEKGEKQGKADLLLKAPVRDEDNGAEVMNSLKQKVNHTLEQIMKKETSLGQQEILLLTDAYFIPWTHVYQKSEVITKVIRGIDDHYRRYLKNPKIIYTDASVYNSDWMTTALLARSFRKLYEQIKDSLDTQVGQVVRRDAWSELMEKSIDFGITHRRHYTNQTMMIDLATYDCNRAQMLLHPEIALPEYQALKYLYESVGLTPWMGKETSTGPEKPLGDNYWQLSVKGLTKELGYTGYYGEVTNWIIALYEATCCPGQPDSGDAKILQQAVKAMKARNYFRYPALDEDGFRCMRSETVVGWRDDGHYPSEITYTDRGDAMLTAATTLHPEALGGVQQMLSEGQYFKDLRIQIKEAGTNIRRIQMLIHIPDEYEKVKQQPASQSKLPMAFDSSDFVFSDEEDGVVAIKHGNDILYASLYWRARAGINKLAKVHYITPTIDRISNICIHAETESDGMIYRRTGNTNIELHAPRDWYKNEVESAHTGEEQIIARFPEGIKCTPGRESCYAGKADYYQMEYGNYIIAMNCSKTRTFKMDVPTTGSVVNLSDNQSVIREKCIQIKPMTTVVLYVGTTK